jgi:hypothetical protein
VLVHYTAVSGQCEFPILSVNIPIQRIVCSFAMGIWSFRMCTLTFPLIFILYTAYRGHRNDNIHISYKDMFISYNTDIGERLYTHFRSYNLHPLRRWITISNLELSNSTWSSNISCTHSLKIILFTGRTVNKTIRNNRTYHCASAPWPFPYCMFEHVLIYCTIYTSSWLRSWRHWPLQGPEPMRYVDIFSILGCYIAQIRYWA